jgi:hypothetical protein
VGVGLTQGFGDRRNPWSHEPRTSFPERPPPSSFAGDIYRPDAAMRRETIARLKTKEHLQQLLSARCAPTRTLQRAAPARGWSRRGRESFGIRLSAETGKLSTIRLRVPDQFWPVYRIFSATVGFDMGDFDRCEAHILWMIVRDRWTECLTCSNCGNVGSARFSATDRFSWDARIDGVSDGFTALKLEHGNDFYCSVCNCRIKP